MEKKDLEELSAFIREHRSNEGNFEALCAKLDEEARNGKADETYRNKLQEIRGKWADEYRTAKESGGSAWPEFERFISEFEKAVVEALGKA